MRLENSMERHVTDLTDAEIRKFAARWTECDPDEEITDIKRDTERDCVTLRLLQWGMTERGVEQEDYVTVELCGNGHLSYAWPDHNDVKAWRRFLQAHEVVPGVCAQPEQRNNTYAEMRL